MISSNHVELSGVLLETRVEPFADWSGDQPLAVEAVVRVDDTDAAGRLVSTEDFPLRACGRGGLMLTKCRVGDSVFLWGRMRQEKGQLHIYITDVRRMPKGLGV